MKLKILTLFIQLPLLWACGSDVASSSSKSAEFSISFFAPIGYTYPPNGTAAYTTQSPTKEAALTKVKNDLTLAIAQGITANQIYLYIPPTINYTFVPPSIAIADGDKCLTDGTYVAVSGTVIYKCVGAGSTDAPVSSATQAPAGSTSTGPSINAEDEGSTTPETPSKIKSYPFNQAMTVVATASQALYQNQWNQIARSVQKALEDKKMLFDDEIQVVLL